MSSSESDRSAAAAAVPPVTSLRQRLVIGTAILVAFGALIVAGVYSGDTSPSAPVLSGGPADGGGDRGSDVAAPLNINPVEGWFPASGEGSGCSEPVGVDLIPGYSAILTINGVTIPDDETNVYISNVDGSANPNLADGARVLSAGGSQGHVTWGPEPNCPFGSVLRPTANEVIACIYRLEDGPASCRPTRRPDTFDF